MSTRSGLAVYATRALALAVFTTALAGCGVKDVPCSLVSVHLRSTRPEGTRSALTVTSSATWASGEVALRAPDTKDFPGAVCVPTGETFVFTAQDVGRDVSRTTEAVADGEPITCTASLLAPDAGTLLRVECASAATQGTTACSGDCLGSASSEVLCPTLDPYCDDGTGGGGDDGGGTTEPEYPVDVSVSNITPNYITASVAVMYGMTTLYQTTMYVAPMTSEIHLDVARLPAGIPFTYKVTGFVGATSIAAVQQAKGTACRVTAGDSGRDYNYCDTLSYYPGF